MTRQLHLLGKDDAEQAVARRPGWRIDARTKAAGERGLAQARAALRAARLAPHTPPPAPTPKASSNVRRSAA